MDVPKKERTINQVKSKSFRAFHKLGILPGFMTHNYDWLTNRVHSQGCRISRHSPNTRLTLPAEMFGGSDFWLKTRVFATSL